MPRLATMDCDGWELDDGEVAHAASPETYWIPPHDARSTLEAGALVKLRFIICVEEDDGEIVENGERMWVEVGGRVEELYRGVLTNQPACTDDIAPGLEVWFQPRHVIDIFESE